VGDLPNVCTNPEYTRANPGFSYDYQFIDVGDVDGRGESEPIPYFYQVPTPLPPTTPAATRVSKDPDADSCEIPPIPNSEL